MQNQWWFIIWPHCLSKTNRFGGITVHLAIYHARYPNNTDPIEWDPNWVQNLTTPSSYFMNLTCGPCNNIMLTLFFMPKPFSTSSSPVPLWPSECWQRSLDWCRAGCCSGTSPAPALFSCSDCSWRENASLLPPSQSLQAACSGCQLPHQKLYHLRIWRLRPKSRTDRRHRATEDGWEGEAGLKARIGLTVYHLLGKLSFAVFFLSNYVFLFFWVFCIGAILVPKRPWC